MELEQEEGIEIPLPYLGSSSEEDASDEDEHDKEDEVSGQTGLRVEKVLQAIIEGRDHEASKALLTLSYWRDLASADGLHVLELEPDEYPQETVESSEAMRTTLQQRGYIEGSSAFPGDEAAVLARLTRGMKMLKRHGLAPTFIYVFDEAWLVLERCWRTLAEVLHAGDSDVVLEVTLSPSPTQRLCAHCRRALPPHHSPPSSRTRSRDRRSHQPLRDSRSKYRATRRSAAISGCRTATTRARTASTQRVGR